MSWLMTHEGDLLWIQEKAPSWSLGKNCQFNKIYIIRKKSQVVGSGSLLFLHLRSLTFPKIFWRETGGATTKGCSNFQSIILLKKLLNFFDSFLSRLITWVEINLFFWPLCTVNPVLSPELSVWRNSRVLHTLAMWMYETLCSEAFFGIRTFSGFMSRCAI